LPQKPCQIRGTQSDSSRSISKQRPAMLRLQNSLIDNGACEMQFACDLQACRGACCTMPGPRGAPLRDDEIEQIHRWYPVVRPLLSEEHVNIIEDVGPYQGTMGDFTTTCVNHRACVFVFVVDGIAQCAFEHAYVSEQIPWQKPISCHLFPIRVRYGALREVFFEYIPQCEAALTRGRRQNVFLSDFLQESLTRTFGSDWYEAFLHLCREHRENKTI
jgi:hypothetical protein